MARTVATVTLLDVFMLAMPSYSYTEIGYRGLHLHKNDAGMAACIATVFYVTRVWMLRHSWHSLFWVGLFCLNLVVLGLSRSKTSAVVSLVGLTMTIGWIFIGGLSSSAKAIAISCIIAVLIVVALFLVVDDFSLNQIVMAVTGDNSLTGRDRLWEFVWAHIGKKPILGVGYASFWYTDTDNMESSLALAGITWSVGEAHNGYLDILLQLGAVGAAALVLMTIAVFLSISRLPSWGNVSLVKFIAIYLTVSVYVQNITESALLRVAADSWVFFVVAIMAVVRFAPIRRCLNRGVFCTIR